MDSHYIPTGIAGVDKTLGEQGIPRGHTGPVAGGPGSGKTTFAIQFLYTGATEHGEPGLYITLDEDPEEIKKNMSNFRWDLDELEREEACFHQCLASPCGAHRRSGPHPARNEGVQTGEAP
jgi:circadian clock protein KaiC